MNFLSKECNSYGKGVKVGEGEFIQVEDNEEVFYCHYKDNEIEQCFKQFEVIYKEKRLIKRKIDDKEYISAYFDYILMKK